jgi:hypothetical protein
VEQRQRLDLGAFFIASKKSNIAVENISSCGAARK